MADLQLPPSINDTRSRALLQLVKRLKALDLTPMLVYRMASLPDSAVLAMAWQFDVLNPAISSGIATGESWDAISDVDALTNVDRLASVNDAAAVSDFTSYRELIEDSVALHAKMGTPAALLNAVGNLGYPNASLLEGQSTWGGTSWPASQGWAVFRLVVRLAAGQTITTTQIGELATAANFWKPARCWLDSVQFIASPEVDSLVPAPSDATTSNFSQFDRLAPAVGDLIVALAWPLADSKTITPRHDGRYYHIGTSYGANEPAVADSGVVVNGVAIASNG